MRKSLSKETKKDRLKFEIENLESIDMRAKEMEI